MKILWIINGLGMGNSTRCHSVMEYLNADKSITCEHQVITGSNGIAYFENIKKTLSLFISKTSSINGLEYKMEGSGKISPFSTVINFIRQLSCFMKSTKYINKEILSFDPDIIITDSTYYPFKKLRATHIAINNADMVVSEYKRTQCKGLLPFGVRGQYYCIEYPDYLFHRTIPDFVISPTFEKNKSHVKASKLNKGNYFHVSPFCRKEIFNCRNKLNKKNNINMVWMFTGSACSSNDYNDINHIASDFIMENSDENIYIDIIGHVSKKENDNVLHRNIRFHGKLVDNSNLISNADVCIINAGFSAIGELHLLNKIYGVIPVENHCEQYLNAEMSKKYSNGYPMASLNKKELNLFYAFYKNKILNTPCEKKAPNKNGSEEASSIISNIFLNINQ